MKWYDVNAFKMFFCRLQGLTLEQSGDSVGISLKSVNYHMKQLKKIADKLQLYSYFEKNKKETENIQEKVNLAGEIAAKFFEENKNKIYDLKAGKNIDTNKEEEKQKNNDSILKRAIEESIKIKFDKSKIDFINEIEKANEMNEIEDNKDSEQKNIDKIYLFLIPIFLLGFSSIMKNEKQQIKKSKSEIKNNKNIDPLAQYRY